MARRRRFPRITLALAGGLVVAAMLWWAFGVSALVKYPTDLDVNPRYEGTFSLHVDPTTAAPLATPLEQPLTIDRHIRAVGDESGADTVVVKETIAQKAGNLVDTTQTNVYVMDRKTLENLADDRAYAFDPENVVDRAGAYRLNLPFDTSRDETYPIYKNEIDATYQLRPNTADPTTHEEGLKLANFVTAVDEAPLSEAYLAELRKTVPLPEAMTLDQLKPQLQQYGLNVDALLAALAPSLTAADFAALGELAANPIPLHYVISFEGRAAVEQTTGAEVDVGVAERIGARPELTALPELEALLGRYPDVPEAVTAVAALDEMVAAPAPLLFEYRYDQTPESVADIADEVTSMRRQILLAKFYLPFGLLIAALLSLVVGLLVHRRRRPERERVAEIDLRTRPAPPGRRPDGVTVGGDTGRDEDRSERGGNSDA
jgi:Porin PorA